MFTSHIYSCTLARTISSNSTVMMKRSSEAVFDTSDLYHCEYERLKTFASWPVKFITHTDMASAGFYYIAHGYDVCDCHASYCDTVRCAFCGLMLENWEKGDVPMNEHKKWAPSCSFILKNSVKET